MGKKLTTDEFIEKAKEIHGDKYDYSEAVYINARTKVKIICPIHGEFFQEPHKHMRGSLCPKCNVDRQKLTAEDFIKKAREVHGDKFDYSKAKYINYDTKVEIICPEHGSFFQAPNSHLSGTGCPMCANNQKLDLSTFIKKAIIIHNGKYDYSKVIYLNNHTKVKIICPEHGEFLQRPYSHLNESGCPICSYNKLAEERKMSFDSFFEKAFKAHGAKYDYSLVEYKNCRTKVKIICPEHGEFFQTPSHHLSGKGCPICAHTQSPQELKIRRLLENQNVSYAHNIIIDDRYPWHVDIYISERDLFLEYNGFYSHGDCFCDRRKKKSKNLIELLSSNPTPKNIRALDTYTRLDPLKRKTAKKNNLNYVVLWNEQDIEDWFALGCPDGHDGDGMYTWKEKIKK